MIIQASVGNTPPTDIAFGGWYSLRLVAQTHGERQRLASLLKAIREMPAAVLNEKPVPLRIIEPK